MRMGVVYRLADGGEKVHDIFGLGKPTLVGGLCDVIGQGVTFDIIHHHVGYSAPGLGSVKDLEVIDLHNVRMV